VTNRLEKGGKTFRGNENNRFAKIEIIQVLKMFE